MNNNNNNNNGRRPLYYYYILAMVVLMALNTWVFPAMFKTKVSDLSYDAFIQMVDEGKFGKVEISDKRIAATAKDPEDKKIYVTGRVDDNQLVEKGQSVTKGTPLLVTEAMKMETTIAAPIGGIIGQIHVQAGSRIESGDCLLEIDSKN